MSQAAAHFTRDDVDFLVARAEQVGEDRAAAVHTLVGLLARVGLVDVPDPRWLLEKAAERSAPAALALFSLGEGYRIPLPDPDLSLAAGVELLSRRRRFAEAIPYLQQARDAGGSAAPLACRLLELAYTAQGLHGEAAGLLRETAPPGLASVEGRLAEALRRDKDPGARQCYSALIADGPDVYATLCLEEILDDASSLEGLAELYTDAARRALEPRVRALYRYRLGEVCEAAGEVERAAAAFSAAAEGGDLALVTLERRRLVSRRAADTASYSRLLRQQAELIAEPHRAAALLLLAGREHLTAGELEPALRCFLEAQERDSTQRCVLEYLVESHLRLGAPEAAARLHDGALAALLRGDAYPSSGVPVACAFLAGLHQGDLGGLAAAARSWSNELPAGDLAAALATFASLLPGPDVAARLDLARAVGLSPGFVPAHLARARVAKRSGRIREALDGARAVAELIDDSARAVDMLLDAVPMAGSLGDPEEVTRLYRRAASHLLGAERAIPLFEIAERLAADGPWYAHREALVAEAQRAGLRKGLAGLLREEGLRAADAPTAESLLLEALVLVPADPIVREALAQRLEERGAWEQLVDLLESAVLSLVDPQARGELLERAARLAAGPLGDQERAQRILARAMATASLPESEEELGAEEEPLEKAAALVEEARLGSDKQASMASLQRAGELYRRGGDLQRAIEVYRQALSLDDADARVLNSLARVLRTSGRRKEAAEVLAQLAACSGDAQTEQDLMLAQARILDASDGDLEAAMALYEEHLSRHPESVEALAALARLYESVSSPRRRHEVLVRWLDHVAGPHRAKLELEVARLEIQLGEAEEALSRLAGAPDRIPPDPGALRLLIEAAEELGDWIRAASARELLARHVDDPAERSRLYMQAARSYRDHLGGGAGMLENTMLAFVCDNDNREAFDELERLYVAAGRWREVVGIYDLALARAGAGGAYGLADLLRRRGLVEARNLDRPTDAAHTLLEALRVDPKDAETVSALETLVTVTGDHRARVEMLALRAEACEGAERDQLMGLAASACEEGGDYPGAVAFLRQVRARNPNQPEAVERLAASLADAAMWSELVDLHREMADRAGPSRSALPHLLAASGVLEIELQDLPAAIAALERADDLAAGTPEVLESLAQLYGRTGQWDRQAEILTRQAEACPRPELRAAKLAEVGNLAQARLRDPRLAKQRYSEALLADEGCLAALAGLSELLSKAEEWDAAVEVLHRRLERCKTPPTRADVLHRLARVHLDGRDDAIGAALAWREALRGVPDHVEAGRGYLALLEQDGAWDEALPLADLAAQLARARDDGEAWLQAMVARARISVGLGDAEAAGRALVSVLGAEAARPSALAVLAELVESRAAESLSGALLDELESAVGGTEANPSGLDWVCLLRGRAAEADGRVGDALMHYRQGLSLDPQSAGGRRALSHLLGRLRRWPEAAQVFEELADRGGGGASWLALLVEAAEIHLDRLNSPERAAQLFARVIQALDMTEALSEEAEGEPRIALELDVGSPAADREALFRRAAFGLAQSERMRGRPAEGVVALQRILARPDSGREQEERARYHHYLARLMEDLPERRDQALASYEQALTLAPTDAVCVLGVARALNAAEKVQAADEILERASQRVGLLAGQDSETLTRVILCRAALRQARGDVEGALEVLGNTPEEHVDQSRIQSAMAPLWVAKDRESGVSRALGCYRRVVALDPAHRGALRGLEMLYAQAGRGLEQAQVRALRSLVDRPGVGAATSGDTGPASSRRPGSEGLLEAELFVNHVLHEDVAAPLWTLWGLASEFLAKRHPLHLPDDPALGRVWPDYPQHPVSRELVEAVALLGLGGPERFEAYVSPKAEGVVLLPGSPAVLLVGGALLVEGADLARLRFFLTRAMTFAMGGRGLAGVTDRGLANGAARDVVALYRSASGKAGRRQGRGRQGFPRSLLKAARAALRREDQSEQRVSEDPRRLLRGVERTAERVALLAFAEPRGALRGLLGAAAMSPSSCRTAIRSRADAADLVRYAVSEDHFLVRRTMAERNGASNGGSTARG